MVGAALLAAGSATLTIGTFLPYGFMDGPAGERKSVSGLRWGRTGDDVSLEFYGLPTGGAAALVLVLACAQLSRIRRHPREAPTVGAWTAIVAVVLGMVAAWCVRQDWQRAREYSQSESIEFGYGLVLSAMALAVTLLAAAVMLVVDGRSLRFGPLKQAFGRWMDGPQH